MTILNVPAFAETTREDSNFQTASFDDTALQSRGLICPRFTINFLTLQSEGAGNAGRRSTRSRACSGSVARALVTTSTPETPGIARAMVLTVSFVLSPVTGLFCHRHRQNCFRQLDTSVGASGPHDFAVRFSLARQARIRVHRIPPRACDVASRPSEWDETVSRYSC